MRAIFLNILEYSPGLEREHHSPRDNTARTDTLSETGG
jgi:hypothetical protein